MDFAHIVFTGTIAFLLGAGPPYDKAEAVFPQGSNWPNDVERHEVYLIVNTDQFKVHEIPDFNYGGRKHETGEVISEMGRKYRYYVIDFESLKIDEALANDDDTDFEPSSVTVAPDGKLTEDNYESLHWVPDLSKIYPLWWRFGAHAPADTCTAHPDAHYVMAQMSLDHGYLATTFVSPYLWRFSPCPLPHRAVKQQLAQEVTMRVNLKNSRLKIDSFDLGTRKPIGSFVIKRRRGTSSRDPLTVILANVPPENAVPSDSPALASTEISDPHFKLYYNGVFAQTPWFAPVPYRRIQDPVVLPFPTPLSVGGPNCPPSQGGGPGG